MPTTDQYWALPDGISEALPEESWRLENLRRSLLDVYATWGYQMVMPPLVEYMQSLNTGIGSNLDLQTFKVTDQLTGRTLGIRADMTPQIARIDAHKLKTEHPNRLCYIGSVLRTRAFNEDGSRSPLQVGAELFGHDGEDSDFEVIALLLTTLKHCQVPAITLDIGHVNIFRSLAAQANLSTQQEKAFFDLLERKSLPDIEAWLASANLPVAETEMLRQLPRLYGKADILDYASNVLSSANQQVKAAINYLKSLVTRIQNEFPDCHIHVDLTELSGYDYHTGIVYAVYAQGSGREIARGGRYDGIGKIFGRARPATGFSTDLRLLTRYWQAPPQQPSKIFAPADTDPSLNSTIQVLRSQGRWVVRQLQGDTVKTPQDAGCGQQLIKHGNEWIITEV
ncbi:MAG: ATP phosphoribosyltransferase regulatory subunit [Thiothrix sp.]|nr:MAG: ATP phosphoribosyltransferase regulatory subunit [Thiothrix sp.]